jgi:hypothetical protein
MDAERASPLGRGGAASFSIADEVQAWIETQITKQGNADEPDNRFKEAAPHLDRGRDLHAAAQPLDHRLSVDGRSQRSAVDISCLDQGVVPGRQSARSLPRFRSPPQECETLGACEIRVLEHQRADVVDLETEYCALPEETR